MFRHGFRVWGSRERNHRDLIPEVSRDAFCHEFSDGFLIPCGVGSSAFPVVGDESAFDEDGGVFGFSNDFEVFAFDAAIFAAHRFHHRALHHRGELSSSGTHVEGFNSSDAAVCICVVVNAHKDAFRNSIGDADSFIERDKGICPAGHDGKKPAAAQFFFQFFCGGECDATFTNAAPVRTLVFTAMSGIDDDDRSLSGREFSGQSRTKRQAHDPKEDGVESDGSGADGSHGWRSGISANCSILKEY